MYLVTFLISFSLASCDDDDKKDEPPTPQETTNNEDEISEEQQKFKSNPYYSRLVNTKWKVVSVIKVYQDGTTSDRLNDIRNSPIEYIAKLADVEFSLEPPKDNFSEYGYLYSPTLDYLEYTEGRWLFLTNGNLWSCIRRSAGSNLDNKIARELEVEQLDVLGSGKIRTLNDERLVIEDDSKTYQIIKTYERIHFFSTVTGGNQGGGSGGGNSYEKPEIGLMDYDCYSTSITVRWRIYNQDKANVTSAKGYYGTSSASRATSATVSGSLITVRFTGLQKNTTYYLKCTATGKGGTTTSETTRLSTN